MVIISFSSYPSEVAPQVAERLASLPALPDHMKLQGPYGYFSGVDGFRAVTIYEFEEPKMAEAVWAIGARVSAYNDIPGFKIQLQICGSPGDAERVAQLRESS